MKSNIKTTPTKVGSYIDFREKDYIEQNLLFFIDKKKKTYRSNLSSSGWHANVDHETEIRCLLLDYILNHFNVYELFIIFFRQDCYKLTLGIISEARYHAIENINGDDSFSPEEKKRLKRKVWDMNPIVFGLVLEFVHLSDLFWDYDKEDYVLPEFN
jgi:hypothetical protein